jgi:chromosome segregation ATPase
MGINGTNGTEIVAEPRPGEEILRLQKLDHRQAAVAIEKAPGGAVEPGHDFVLAPLVDKIAYGIARGLVVAMKELENHIATETRKVGDSVDRRLDALQGSFQDLAAFVSEQRSINQAVQEKCQQLAAAAASLQEFDARQAVELEGLRTDARDLSTALEESDVRQAAEFALVRGEAVELSAAVSQRIDATTASLKESDARQAAELAALRGETREFSKAASERMDGLCKELGIQQEDIAAVKSTLSNFSSRVDALVERLDRQADAVRSMCSAYSQRETELEQLVDGLARLRAYPTPMPVNGL